jgi:hypothetical protein
MTSVARGALAASTVVTPDVATIHLLCRGWLMVASVGNDNENHPWGKVGVVIKKKPCDPSSGTQFARPCQK